MLVTPPPFFSLPFADRSKTSAQASSPGERVRGRASTVATSADAAERDIGARIAAHLEVIEAYINRHKQALIHFMTKVRVVGCQRVACGGGSFGC